MGIFDAIGSIFGGGSSGGSGGSTVSVDPTKNGGSGDPWTPPPVYTPGPGLQPGTPQTQIEGLDFTQRGPSEQYFLDNKAVWEQPSFGEVNNQGLVSHYSDPGNRPQLTNNSSQAYGDYRSQMPSIATDPGLGAYFDNAKNRATESINQTMAARGAYGSSAANDQISRSHTDLEGQRALKEADYNLARLGEQRGWLGLGGQLAGLADSRSDAASADEQRWAQLLSQLGLDSSRLGLQRTNAGADAAANAQGAERSRGGDFFSNQQGMGDRMAELYRIIMGPALDNDAALFGNANSGGIAGANAGVANENANAATTVDAAKTGMGIYDWLKK
jgi:hypothetical protein